jgi:hypothetical protein
MPITVKFVYIKCGKHVRTPGANRAVPLASASDTICVHALTVFPRTRWTYCIIKCAFYVSDLQDLVVWNMLRTSVLEAWRCTAYVVINVLHTQKSRMSWIAWLSPWTARPTTIQLDFKRTTIGCPWAIVSNNRMKPKWSLLPICNELADIFLQKTIRVWRSYYFDYNSLCHQGLNHIFRANRLIRNRIGEIANIIMIN